MSAKGMRKHGDEWHKSLPCPSCVEDIDQVEPYEDWTGESVECSRCWDKREICLTCEEYEAEL